MLNECIRRYYFPSRAKETKKQKKKKRLISGYIDPDKVYDYHTAFDIKPTEVVYNVDINANQKEIKNIKLNRQNDNSAATVALVKEVAPFTKNALYRLYFSEIYDFANADSYGINIGSSGVIINSVKPNITCTLPTNKDLSEIKKRWLKC